MFKIYKKKRGGWFDPHFVNMVMLCVSTVQYHVSVNGKLVGSIFLERGLRQGDPLSPYLFIIYAKGRSTMLKEAKVGCSAWLPY